MKLASPSAKSQSEVFELDEAQLERLGQILDDLLVESEAGRTPQVELACQQNEDIAAAIRYYVRSIQVLHQYAYGGPKSASSFLQLTESERLPQLSQQPLGDLGEFKLIREIGRGGMGVVYEAQQHSLMRRVAVKVLPFAAVLDSRQIARFHNEAQAAASLQHPNIVPVYSVGNDRGTHFYSMQYVDGNSLDTIVQQQREANVDIPSPALPCPESAAGHLTEPLNDRQPAQAPVGRTPSTLNDKGQAITSASYCTAAYIRGMIELFIQAAEALHYAHQHGIVHRDVKPSNLMVDSSGKLWVTDFGLAQCRIANGASGKLPNLTRTGDFLGTLRYMSPEQALGQSHLVDFRTDVYSLGATLYELLTLRSVISGADRLEMIRQIDLGKLCSPRTLNPAISVELETILLKSMARDRDDRYATADELAEDLRRYQTGVAPLARRPTLLDRAGRFVRQRPKAVILSGLAVLLMLVASSALTILLKRKNRQIETALNLADQHLSVANQAVYRFGPMQLRRLELLAGSEAIRLETAQEALNYFQSFAKYAKNAPGLQKEVASAHLVCGDLELQLGRLEHAVEQFTSGTRLLERIDGKSSLVPDVELLLGLNNLAVAQERSGDLTSAKATLEKALVRTFGRQMEAAASSDPLNCCEVLLRLHLGQTLASLGEASLAQAEFKRALRIAENIVLPDQLFEGRNSLADEIPSLMISTMLESSRLEQVPADQVMPLIESAIELAAACAAKVSPDQDSDQLSMLQKIAERDLALCQLTLGGYLLGIKQIQPAKVALKEAAKQLGYLHRIDPAIQQFSLDFATALNNLGQCDLELGNFQAANESFTKAAQLLEQVSATSDNYLVEHSLGGVHNNLSILHELKGDLHIAESEIRKAIEFQSSALARSPNNRLCESFLNEHRSQLAHLLQIKSAAIQENDPTQPQSTPL